MSLLQLPAKLSTPFLPGNGRINLTRFSPRTSSISLTQTRPFPVIKAAMQIMEGKVTCATSDKTVAVEVTRLAPHPKYKRRVRIKKKYQAHDPENVFKKGDIVQLRKIKPISKNKSFIAVPAPPRNSKKGDDDSGGLGIPLQSQQVGEGQSKD